VAQQQPIQRRLVAILAADVAGYSRLTGADEEGTLERLRALRRDLIDPAITEHHGRIVKTTGDGFLIEFSSVVDAVRCAIAVQRGMARRNTEVSVEKRLLFRIGVNLGDVVAEGDDLLGDGVNVPARLEGIAEAGGICLSLAAYDQTRGKIDLAVKDLGEQRLKNIAEPVQVYGVSVNGNASISFGDGVQGTVPSQSSSGVSETYRKGAGIVGAIAVGIAIVAGVVWFVTRPGPPSPTPQAPRLSIVVLPFTNLSGDPAQDYLADTITEELTARISRISGTFVIARTTAFTYKGKSLDVKQIGKELGVRYVFEGSEQHGGNRVRVNAQLVDAQTGAHLWADQFDVDRSDLTQGQDKIVIRMARALLIQLPLVDAARLARAPPGNLDAEDLSMRCEAAADQGEAAGMLVPDEAYRFCERALQIDDNNVRALTLLAQQHFGRVAYAVSTDRETDLRKADEYISRALATDPNSSQAHMVKGAILVLQRRDEEAIVEQELSLALNPSNVSAYVGLCYASIVLLRLEATVEYAERAIRLSPRDPALSHFENFRGQGYFLLKKDGKAIEALRRSVALAPTPWPYAFLVAALAFDGRDAEAHEALGHYLSLSDNRPRTISQWRQQVRAYSDNPAFLAAYERLYEGLRKAGMPEE
jgi:TolB-like protein/class 3 adenylate cyclase/Flp pilus assembly protein TadD